MATEKYNKANFSDVFTHLTNYSLNKKNQGFSNDDHKLRVQEVLKGNMTQPAYRPDRGSASRSADEIWDDIELIIVKTILTVQPQLQHIYRSSQPKEPDCCFELLGFDIILDAKLKPWMLEVNHTPSFQTDTEIDEKVKFRLLKDTFDIVQLSCEQRRQKEWELKQEKKNMEILGTYKRPQAREHCDRVRFNTKEILHRFPDSGYRQIYPSKAPGSDPNLYEKIYKRSHELYQI